MTVPCRFWIGEIRFLKLHDIINSNSWLLAMLKEFSGLPLFKLILFFLKLNRILTKLDAKLWEDSICE